MSKLRFSLFSLTLLLLLCVGYHFWGKDPASGSSPAVGKMMPVVRVETVSLSAVANQLPLVGKLSARQSVVITPEVSGRIVKLPTAEGGRVVAGARLVQLDDDKQQASYDEAQAFLVNEQRKLGDMTRLASKGVTTRNDLDGQASSVAQAVARRDMAAFELSQRHLLAPFAGRVGLYDISLGSLVNPGDVLLHLDDTSVMRLDLAVPERFLSQLQPGMPLHASTEAWPGVSFSGVLSSIDSRVDSDTLNIKVRLLFANEDERLRPGMLMQLTLPFATQVQPLIPMQAIEFQGDERFVYLLTPDQHVQRRRIELGEPQDSRVAVRSGLQGGEPLVVEGIVALRDGIKVKVVASAQAQSVGDKKAGEGK